MGRCRSAVQDRAVGTYKVIAVIDPQRRECDLGEEGDVGRAQVELDGVLVEP
jgi:hypothetical protein